MVNVPAAAAEAWLMSRARKVENASRARVVAQKTDGQGVRPPPGRGAWSDHFSVPALWSSAGLSLVSGGVVNGALYVVGYMTFRFVP